GGGSLEFAGEEMCTEEERRVWSSRRIPPPIDLQHNAQKDCGRGVLPFTTTNFICRFGVSFLTQREFIGESPRSAHFSLFIGLRLVFHHLRERLGRPRSTA